MAAGAAKYGHCEIGYPVEYRSKVPFRPEITAPLDLAVRIGEIYALDRELDRAVLEVDDYLALLKESIGPGLGPVDFQSGDPISERDALHSTPATSVPLGSAGLDGEFQINELQLINGGARFEPPWTVPLVQEVHALLVRHLPSDSPPGGLRTRPFTVFGPGGRPLLRACPTARVEGELAALLTWVDRVGPTLNPLIPAAVLLQGFHSIRPFLSGNLTVGWTMAQLHLNRFGLPNSGLVPAASAMFSHPELLDRLMLWTEAKGSYSELLDFTADALLLAYRQGVDRWLPTSSLDHKAIEETALRLLTRSRRKGGWFTAAEAANWVGNRGEQTVLRHLNELVRRGILESLGRTRGKRYRVISRSRMFPELARRLGGGLEEPAPATSAELEVIPGSELPTELD